MRKLFELQDAAVRYGESYVLRDATLELSAGEFVAIAGPNGAGKSTLLSLLAGLLAPSSGDCHFLHRPCHRWPRRDFAKRVAVVTQPESSSFAFTAEDLVYMGRVPHRSSFNETEADRRAVDGALLATEAEAFRHREFRTLSAGEKQRVLLASALAQSPEVLLLDEPASHLDLHHQVALYKMLRRLSEQGLLVVAITHDLNLAAAQAHRMVLLHHGSIRAQGTAYGVLDPSLISEIFQVDVDLHCTVTGQPWLIYG